MNYNTTNSIFIKLGEDLRNRYLFQMEDKNNPLKFYIARHKKRQFIKDKIIKLVQC